MGVYEGDFKGEGVQQGGEFFHREPACGEMDDSVGEGAFFLFLREGFLPAGLGAGEAGFHVGEVPGNGFPFFFFEILGTEGEEDVVFLVNHFFGSGEGGGEPLLPLGRLADGGAGKAPFFQISQGVPDFIVHAPHDVGGAGEAVVHLQDGVEDVLFIVMEGNPAESCQFVHQVFSCVQSFPHFFQAACDGFVFQGKDGQGVAGDGAEGFVKAVGAVFPLQGGRGEAAQGFLYFGFGGGNFFRSGGAVEEGGVDVAESLHIPEGNAAFQKGLFCQGDFTGVHVFEMLHKVCPHLFQVFSGGKAADIFSDSGGSFIRCSFHGRSRFLLRRLGEGTAQGKAVGHEGGNHLSHVDVHHHGPFGNGHETAQGVEGCFFGNAGKSQFLHNRNEFRVFFHQVMYVFCKINDF